MPSERWDWVGFVRSFHEFAFALVVEQSKRRLPREEQLPELQNTFDNARCYPLAEGSPRLSNSMLWLALGQW